MTGEGKKVSSLTTWQQKYVDFMTSFWVKKASDPVRTISRRTVAWKAFGP